VRARDHERTARCNFKIEPMARLSAGTFSRPAVRSTVTASGSRLSQTLRSTVVRRPRAVPGPHVQRGVESASRGRVEIRASPGHQLRGRIKRRKGAGIAPRQGKRMMQGRNGYCARIPLRPL
jgi:hypothetical protein